MRKSKHLHLLCLGSLVSSAGCSTLTSSSIDPDLSQYNICYLNIKGSAAHCTYKGEVSRKTIEELDGNVCMGPSELESLLIQIILKAKDTE